MDSNQPLVVHSEAQAFFGLPCGWPIFHLLFVSDPVELHRVFEGLVLSLLRPPNASNTHLTQPNLLLCPLRECFKRSPGLRDKL